MDEPTRTTNTPHPELVEVSGHSCGKARPVRGIARLAETQDGVVGHGQLIALGVSVDWIEHRIRAGWLHIVFRGAYAVGHKRVTWRGRLRAAILSCGPGAYISHRTAGALHNLRRSSSALIHVTVPPGGREDRQQGIRLHRIRNMREEEKDLVDDIPVTSVARTCLDLAARSSRHDVDALLEAAERNGSFDLTAFIAVCKRGRNGSAKLKRALVRYQPTGWTRSRLERTAIRELANAGRHPTGVNVWVAAAAVEVDLLFENEKVAVEIDGGIVHGTTAARIRDPQRDIKLAIAGYLPVRIAEYRLVHETSAAVEDVVAVLLSRGERTPARPGR